MSKKEIYISYAWGSRSEEIVNQLDKALQDKGITIIRDKHDLGFKGRIKEFMEQLGRGKAVIVIISEEYLKSENCMFELVQIAKNGQFYDRIFPIVLADAQIYKPVQRIKYIQHWEQQIKDLDEAMKTVSAANLQGFREEIDQYAEIRNTIAELTNIIKDMNALTPEMHSETNFKELIDAIERKMAETIDESKHKVQEFTDTGTETQRRLRLTVHEAIFLPNGSLCYFINATNLSERDIEITHVWFDCEPQFHVFQADRPLPKRLKPDETWETWIEVDRLPGWVHENPYKLARARLSTGAVIESQKNENVPERGSVPGGPITRIWTAQGNRNLGQIVPVQLPQLILKLFLESGLYQDDIILIQPQPDGVVQDYYFPFGLALQNVIEKSVPAKDIDIRVEISWNGAELQSAPEFTTDNPGWQALRSKIQQAGDVPLPAVLEFKGAEQDRCSFGHPLEWNGFRGHLSRKTNGYFSLHYRISSASPHTTSTDELRIFLQ
jgi:hypothetical protein